LILTASLVSECSFERSSSLVSSVVSQIFSKDFKQKIETFWSFEYETSSPKSNIFTDKTSLEHNSSPLETSLKLTAVFELGTPKELTAVFELANTEPQVLESP
jgi:hypothetical protein